MENTNETQKSKLILHFIIESRVNPHSVEKYILLIFRKFDACQHNSLGTGLDLTFSY